MQNIHKEGVKDWRERGKETKEIIILQRINTLVFFLEWVSYLTNTGQPLAIFTSDIKGEKVRMQIPWPHTFSKRVQIPEICLLTFQRSEKRKIITIHKDKCHYSSVYKVKYLRKREEYFIMFGKVRAGELLRQIFKAEQEMQPGSEDYFKAEFTRVNPKALGPYFTSCVIVARVCIFSAAVILIKMAFFFSKTMSWRIDIRGSFDS